MTAEFLLNLGIPPELVVVVIAMLPISELRGAIPVGINVLGLPWTTVLPLAIMGNLLPIPFILFLLKRAVGILDHISLFHRFFSWLFAYTARRSGLIQKYKRIGLMLFVAIPLPITGAWTASVAAVLFAFELKNALLFISLGALIAGGIVTALALLGWWGALIAVVALVALAIYSIWKTNHRQPI
jgi:uncharacterized membrane protein